MGLIGINDMSYCTKTHVYCLLILILLLFSCSKIQDTFQTVESERFEVTSFGGGVGTPLKVDAVLKETGEKRKLVNFNSTLITPDISFLNDSILVILNICGGNDILHYIANLAMDTSHCISKQFKEDPFYVRSWTVSELTSDGWFAEIRKKDTEKDLYFISMKSPFKIEWGTRDGDIVVWGADDVALVSLQDSILTFSITWDKEGECQAYQILIPEREKLSVDRFSIISDANVGS